MFGLFKKKSDNQKWKPTERDVVKDDVNSLFDDAHVDPAAKKSNDVLEDLRSRVKKDKLPHLRIRGLKIEGEPIPNGNGGTFINARVEVNIMESEDGVKSFINLVRAYKG